MITTPIVSKEMGAMAKIDEYKSEDGVRFRAKLMGNTVVEEVRGKTVAEYAMAKLKLNIMKQKQHKTRVNISLKWDGFFVYLSDGGQELLHSFPLESISFVWKDPCDDRALGIICSDGSAEKQTMMTKFYGYKTEKPAFPLIMSLKELFGLRTNENNESSMETNLPENENTNKEETPSSIEDLLDLKTDISKPFDVDYVLSASGSTNTTSKWTTFSNVNLFSTFPPDSSFQPGNAKVNTIPTQWPPYPAADNQSSNQMWSNMNSANLHQFSNPFTQPMMFPQPTNFNVNVHNPFSQMTPNPVPFLNTVTIQPQPTTTPQTKLSKNHVDNLFSDLLTTEYCLDPTNISRPPSKNSLNSNGKESQKISLGEMKKNQEKKESIDLSVFEKNNLKTTTAINNQKIESNPMSIPLFQFD